MEQFPNINEYKKIHFIGIGGVSMSSLAMILKESGKIVTGSDSAESPNTDMLIGNGIPVSIGHCAENVYGSDLVVFTAAISDNNPEMVYAKQSSIRLIERAVLLGEMMTAYPHSIAVSGTHGKSTTTSMISSIFLESKQDPTILIGAHLNQIGGNYKVGKSGYSIYEACEYVNSFLHFYPETAVILNIDADHLDFFGDIGNIIKSFCRFTENVRQGGTVIINGDDENSQAVMEKCNCEIVTFGLNASNHCHAENIRSIDGRPVFDAVYGDKIIRDIELSVYGKHNILNALSAICVAEKYGIDDNSIKNGLLVFTGTERRFEVVKSINGASIMVDYAHHPTEIRATIEAARVADYDKITVIFQSHTYTRTKYLMDSFAKELSAADKVILTDIYSAREINTIGANILELRDKIPESEYISDFQDIAKYIKCNSSPCELFILMGAGNINTVADLL